MILARHTLAEHSTLPKVDRRGYNGGGNSLAPAFARPAPEIATGLFAPPNQQHQQTGGCKPYVKAYHPYHCRASTGLFSLLCLFLILACGRFVPFWFYC
jgi:hypothetical protein